MSSIGLIEPAQRDEIVELATRRELPAIYPIREFVAAGSLMSYGTSVTEALALPKLIASNSRRS